MGSQGSAFEEKYCDLSFCPNFGMLMLECWENQVVFEKRLMGNVKLGLGVPGMIEECEFYPNFGFSMNFGPLDPHYFGFCDLSFHRIFGMLILESLGKYA